MTESAKLYTLEQLSRVTGISMPTLQRYETKHPGKIPSVGEGKAKRYPQAAIAVAKAIRQKRVEDDPAHAEVEKSDRKGI